MPALLRGCRAEKDTAEPPGPGGRRVKMGQAEGECPRARTEALTSRFHLVLGLPSRPGRAEEEKGEEATHGRRGSQAGDGTVFFV